MNKIAQKWLDEGLATRLPHSISKEFDTHLLRQPWIGASLNWSLMPRSERLDVSEASPDEVMAWVARTRIGGHSQIVVWYSVEKGGIVVPLQQGVMHLDELYRDAPGVRFAFGADFVKGELKPDYSSILQYGAGDELIATGKPN